MCVLHVLRDSCAPCVCVIRVACFVLRSCCSVHAVVFRVACFVLRVFVLCDSSRIASQLVKNICKAGLIEKCENMSNIASTRVSQGWRI